MGCYWHREARKRLDLNQTADHIRFVLSTTQIMTANSTDQKDASPSQPPDKEQNLVAGETEFSYGDSSAKAPIKGLRICFVYRWRELFDA